MLSALFIYQHILDSVCILRLNRTGMLAILPEM